MQVMTPRTVMFSLPAEMSIDDSIDVDKMWHIAGYQFFLMEI